jgi:hypothetical protein
MGIDQNGCSRRSMSIEMKLKAFYLLIIKQQRLFEIITLVQALTYKT